MLEDITSPNDIKKYSQKELDALAGEMRGKIIEVVGRNGGHLASNLGVVELTIALHRVFQSPRDAIIWDVSHQCYPHKLLTGRCKGFDTLRQRGGISGFTNKNESPHDFFINGHSSTSISAALGLLMARELLGQDGKVVAVIGDGALTGGMAFEGLSHAGQLNKNLIVVLNDNQMSIEHNTGAVSRYLSRLSMSRQYQSLRNFIDRGIDRIPNIFGRHLEKFVYRFKRSLKGLLLTNNLFTDFGFEYVGPLDGHNEAVLERVFKRVKKIRRPVVVHVVTKKGKGYSPAENNPELFHGIGPFQTSGGKVEHFDVLSFTECFSRIILEAARSNPRICAITAAMAKGTGLSAFSRRFPERFFDVGIAEEHAVTFAGGLAEGGMLPVVCIYSTFMQRSVDQMLHDVSLQDSRVIFMLDRAGAVPGDGVTHQGIFDIALFRPVPRLTILCPCSAEDMRLCFGYALGCEHPVLIRYPKLSCPEERPEFSAPVQTGRGMLLKADGGSPDSDKVLAVITGGMYAEVSEAVTGLGERKGLCDIYLLRFIKPLDEAYFVELCARYKAVVFVEDGVITGGIGSYLNTLLLERHIEHTRLLGFEDRFYGQGTRREVLEEAGLSPDCIRGALEEFINA